jgi:hypothetical protein
MSGTNWIYPAKADLVNFLQKKWSQLDIFELGRINPMIPGTDLEKMLEKYPTFQTLIL